MTATMIDQRARPAPSIYKATKPSLLVVPTYNESSNIAELVTRFFASVENVHLIVVNVKSTPRP